MPPAAAAGPRLPVPRSKTYVGCWTCRGRHVKCDAVRPSCQRCAKSKLRCEGYGIRLSWIRHDGSHKPPRQTRLRFSEQDMSNPVFSPEQIDSALEYLDTVDCGPDGVEAAPFAVFASNRALAEHPDPDPDPDPDRQHVPPDHGLLPLSPETLLVWPGTLEIEDEEAYGEADEDVGYLEATSPASSDLVHSHKHSISMMATQQRLAPLLQPFIASSSPEERQLFHFWVTSASALMIATGHPDNPFRHVYVPLAMAAVGTDRNLVGHRSLLHGIYAWAASSLARLQHVDAEGAKRYHELAAKHYQSCLSCLRQSLLLDDAEQHAPTLGAIVLITTMEMVTGTSSHWRMHLRGGRTWLNGIAPTWQQVGDNQIVYQTFRGLEILGFSHDQNKQLDHSRQQSQSSDTSTSTSTTDLPIRLALEANFYKGDASLYQMEKLFGITKPVFDTISTINHLTQVGYTPTQKELDDLESLILMANPCTLRFPSPTEEIERLIRHHACAFYFACVIHYKRLLQHESPANLQYIVEYGLVHFEAIANTEIETELIASGLLWPLFVAASEAETTDLRRRFIEVFASRERLGIAATSQTRRVVQEIWRRRDRSSHPSKVYRHKVMEEMGLDVLLA
ncbi:hypothetical protein A1O3_05536 [Capronia epimyces CBS 606.96]|uniref:Zn(2)-C6 fungal-type domain-containing protein n=1 Tax=Capronia epimyces CBS 606.96 TaxID=1182542 RepID=W9Y6M8_9EURO|nr:uncharacterized protein A1O3_05536 [Capronia epimyces CBS 606.96]EXJ84861.1 hypothetical protein A1O3_05536 [Capronia epimyces CBS 606.96]